jgi:aspartate/methionine/tyrosine aminotransferase
VAAFTPEVWSVVAERRAAFRTRRDLLVAGLRDIGFGVPLTPQGAFYVYARADAFLSGGGDSSFSLAERLLAEAGVAVVPGADFGDFQPHRHLRFSYTTGQDQISEGLRRLAGYLRLGGHPRAPGRGPARQTESSSSRPPV